jgi:hypothetical protein
MKTFILNLVIVLYIILLIAILYYIYNKYKKTETFQNDTIKVLQIGFVNDEKSVFLSNYLKKLNYLIISTNQYETEKYKKHNINAEIFTSYNNQLIDLFYFPFEYNILYLNIDVFTDEIGDFINNHLLKSKLKFKIIISNSKLPEIIEHYILKKYNEYNTPYVYVEKNITIDSHLITFIKSFKNHSQ